MYYNNNIIKIKMIEIIFYMQKVKIKQNFCYTKIKLKNKAHFVLKGD